MAHHTLVAEALTPDQEALTLTLEQGQHVVRVRGEVLMSSRVSGSEAALAKIAPTGSTADRAFSRIAPHERGRDNTRQGSARSKYVTRG